MLKISKKYISVGKTFSASPDILWDLITDTTQWSRWGPTVRAVRTSERYISKGSKGQVLTVLGIWLPFVVSEYEHECFWNWKVGSIRATGHRLQPAEAGGAILWFEVPVIAFPYIAICWMALNRIAGCVAEIRKR
ncbi:MAG: SRPBCC family protein [Deltaproteobacteria bacterium]|jgi:hypothetical protein|nr:SRPBCC family protein [Deltaproteobacteria bacterium]